jgi:hypothetical protein
MMAAMPARLAPNASSDARTKEPPRVTKTRLEDLPVGLRRKVRKLLEAGGERDELEALLEGERVEDASAWAESLDDEYQDELRYATKGEPRRPAFADEAACHGCGEALDPVDRFCDACGAKVLSEDELDHYRRKIEPAMQQGVKWIGGVAILYVLGGITFFLLTDDPAVLVLNLVLALIQVGLWRWSKRNLLPAAIVALVLYLTVHLADAVVDPTQIFRGIIVKVLFLMALWRAIHAGLEARKLTGARS